MQKVLVLSHSRLGSFAVAAANVMPERYRKLAIAAALAGPLISMGACSVTTADITATLSTIEQQVQADANLVCGFIPTLATIASFIPGGAAIAPEAASIAQAICAAIAAAPPVQVQSAKLRSARLGVSTPVNVATVIVPGVGAVPIAGTFTR